MKLTIAAAALCLSMAAASPTGDYKFDTSKLAHYPAAENNGLGIDILVLPGGGYEYVSLDREGTNSTLYLNEKGYDAWVLDYSTAETAPTPLYPRPLDEALGAVRYIRKQNKGKVPKLGIWGYSAGGHLAAVTLTNPAADLDFGILAYPVISLDASVTHEGSRTNLIGENPSPKLVEKLSAENRVTAETPPVFIYHSVNDATVPVENALRFIGALNKNSIPFHALIIPDAGHGIALGLDDPKHDWTSELDRFLTYSV